MSTVIFLVSNVVFLVSNVVFLVSNLVFLVSNVTFLMSFARCLASQSQSASPTPKACVEEKSGPSAGWLPPFSFVQASRGGYQTK